jgi:hypothetical protein
MTVWQTVLRDARAATEVLRFTSGAQSPVPDGRAERVAAAGIGLLVLCGAVGTYLAVVGRLRPLTGDPPADGARPTAVTTRTPDPSPARSPGGAP